MSVIRQVYEDRVARSVEKIVDLEALRAKDVMVDYVFKAGRELFENPLDKMSSDWLVAKGGKLSGALAYLGQQASRARAERDIYEQKVEELLNEKTIEGYADCDDKITLARAKAKAEVSELKEFVIIKEYEKNNYENILEACKSMVMFTQSALRVKEGERYVKGSNYDNAPSNL